VQREDLGLSQEFAGQEGEEVGMGTEFTQRALGAEQDLGTNPPEAGDKYGDERTVLYKTKSLDDTNPRTNPNPN